MSKSKTNNQWQALGTLFVFFVVLGCVSQPGKLARSEGVAWYKVRSVLSGDTILVKGIGRVKYIGVNAPRPSLSGKHDEKFWRESQEKNRQLVEGKWVRFEMDKKREDNLGRTLAYVFVRENERSNWEIFVNAEMLRLGLARLEESTVNLKYMRRLEALEHEARRNARGIWAE